MSSNEHLYYVTTNSIRRHYLDEAASSDTVGSVTTRDFMNFLINESHYRERVLGFISEYSQQQASDPMLPRNPTGYAVNPVTGNRMPVYVGYSMTDGQPTKYIAVQLDGFRANLGMDQDDEILLAFPQETESECQGYLEEISSEYYRYRDQLNEWEDMDEEEREDCGSPDEPEPPRWAEDMSHDDLRSIAEDVTIHMDQTIMLPKTWIIFTQIGENRDILHALSFTDSGVPIAAPLPNVHTSGDMCTGNLMGQICSIARQGKESDQEIAQAILELLDAAPWNGDLMNPLRAHLFYDADEERFSICNDYKDGYELMYSLSYPDRHPFIKFLKKGILPKQRSNSDKLYNREAELHYKRLRLDTEDPDSEPDEPSDEQPQFVIRRAVLPSYARSEPHRVENAPGIEQPRPDPGSDTHDALRNALAEASRHFVAAYETTRATGIDEAVEGGGENGEEDDENPNF